MTIRRASPPATRTRSGKTLLIGPASRIRSGAPPDKLIALVGLAGERSYGVVLQAAACLHSSEVVFGLAENGKAWEEDEVRRD